MRRRVAEGCYAGTLKLTVSVAVTPYVIGESVDEMLARAERVMHIAKQFGGDSVESVRVREPQQRTATVTRLPVKFRERPGT